MPPSQVVSISDVREFVAFTLNATDTWQGALDDPKYGPSGSTGFINQAILDADAIVTKAIMENPLHPKRSAYLTAASAVNGQLLDEHLGPAGDVFIDGSFGIRTTADNIQRWARNADLFDNPEGYFVFEGERFFFNGSEATVDLCTYVRTSACQAPSEYNAVENHLTLALIFKLGGDGAMASHHLQLAMVELQSISGSADVAAVLKAFNE